MLWLEHSPDRHPLSVFLLRVYGKDSIDEMLKVEFPECHPDEYRDTLLSSWFTSHSSKARIFLDTNRFIGPISPLLFSGFIEHMGRAIYEGIYDPASPHADERGFRKDILALLRELNYRAIRYPGGNFLSGYHWLDGVGPRNKRPRHRDLAWQSIETNQFGTNEFMEFCKAINTEPMLGVNMCTGTIEEAANLVEYCNAPLGHAVCGLACGARVSGGAQRQILVCWQ